MEGSIETEMVGGMLVDGIGVIGDEVGNGLKVIGSIPVGVSENIVCVSGLGEEAGMIPHTSIKIASRMPSSCWKSVAVK